MTPSLRSISLDFSIKAQGNFLSAILTAESLTEFVYKKLLPLPTKISLLDSQTLPQIQL